MDSADAQEGPPSEDNVDGGTVHSAEKKLPSENAFDGQTSTGTEATVIDEKCAQNVDPTEQNDMSAPKAKDQAATLSATESSTVIDSKKLTSLDGDADYGNDQCAEGVEEKETNCVHMDDDQSKNKSNNKFVNSPAAADVSQSKTEDLSTAHVTKEAVLKAACEKSQEDGSLPSHAVQPKQDKNLLEATTHSVPGFSLQASTHHEVCDSPGELVTNQVEHETSSVHTDKEKSMNDSNDELSDNQHAYGVLQTCTDETSSKHVSPSKSVLPAPEEAVDTKERHQEQKFRVEGRSCTQLPEEATNVHQSSTDETSSDLKEFTKENLGVLQNASEMYQTDIDQTDSNHRSLARSEQPVQDQAVCELNKDGSSSPLIEQPNCDPNLLEETPASACEDHMHANGSGSQANTHHDTEPGVGCSSGELVIEKNECETEHENVFSDPCQKLNENDSQCQDSNDSISQSAVTGGDTTDPPEDVATDLQENAATDPPLIGPPEVDATDPLEDDPTDPPEDAPTDSPESDAADSPENDAIDPPEESATDPPEDAANPPLICPPEVDTTDLSEDYAVGTPEDAATDPSEDDAADQPEDAAIDPPEVDATDPPEDDVADQPEDAADPPEVDATDPPEDAATDPPEDDAADQPEDAAIDPPEVDATDPPEDDAADQPEVDATDPPEDAATDPPEDDAADQPEDAAIDPPEVDATDPPEDDAADQPEVDATDPPEDDAADQPEDAADPPEVDVTDPPEVDATDPPEDAAATDPPEDAAADLPLICPPEGDGTDPLEDDDSNPREGDASDPPEGDAVDGTDGVICSPKQKTLEHTGESEPSDLDQIQSSTKDNMSQDIREENTCSSEDEVHGSEQTRESQPFDVDHIQSSIKENISQNKNVVEQHEEHSSEQTFESQPFLVDHIQSSTKENISQDISTDKEHEDEHLLQKITENISLTDNVGGDTVTEGNKDQDEVLRNDVNQLESHAKTFPKNDTPNSSHGFVMLSPFTLTREEFDAQGNSSDLKKLSEQASDASTLKICDDIQKATKGKEDACVSKVHHQLSGISEVAEIPCSHTSHVEAGDTDKETETVAGTDDEETGKEVNNEDDEKTANSSSENKPPQQEIRMKSPEKGRISIGYSKRKDKYKCFLCDEVGSGSSFEEHVMQHLLWKPYKCLYCSQYFITRSDIGRHVSESHDGKQLRCGLRAIKKAKDCMREAQRKGTCVYFADKLNGMYWSCKKKKMEDEAKMVTEMAGEGAPDIAPQEESCQDAKQMPATGVDLHKATESNKSDINPISNDSVLYQTNAIQPRSSNFHTVPNTTDTAEVIQGGELRNSMPEAVLAHQSVKPGHGETTSGTATVPMAATVAATVPTAATVTATVPTAATVTASVPTAATVTATVPTASTVTASAPMAATATVTATVPTATVRPLATTTVRAQVQATTGGQTPANVQPITGPVNNFFQSIRPKIIPPQSRNVRVAQAAALTIPPVPLILNTVSGGVVTPVVSHPSNTRFPSVLTTPSNTVVGQLTLSPTKILPTTHIISSNPNQIIIGNQETRTANQGQQANVQHVLIPVSLNTNVNMNPIGVTSVAVCSTASTKGENSKKVQPAKSKGSPDKNKHLQFHDVSQSFVCPVSSANIALLPKQQAPVQNATVLTPYIVPSQQTLSGTPQVLNPTAVPGFIPQSASFMNPNCQLLVFQKVPYGPLMDLKSSNPKVPIETQTLGSPNNPNSSELQHTVTSKRVRVMFAIGLVNGQYVCAACRGRFKYENSFRAHLWNHIHDVNVPCPDCKISVVSGLNMLACEKTEGYIEKLKNGLVGNSSYLEIKAYRAVSNAIDSQHSNPLDQPSKAQKNSVGKSKCPATIDISSEVVSRDQVQINIIPESRLTHSATPVHANKSAQPSVEEQPVPSASGATANAGVACVREEPSLREHHPNNNDELGKSKATSDLTCIQATSGTVFSVNADHTEAPLPSRPLYQDSDKSNKDVAKPDSPLSGQTSNDAMDSQRLAKRSERDCNSEAPSVVKTPTKWTFYVCGAQCGYSSLYPQEFKKHVGECNQPGSMLCSHCQYFSDCPESLVRHLVKHYVGHAPGVAVHACSVSGCRFTTNILQGYYQHLATTHADIKEYECNYCKDAFPDLVSFMKHLQENILHIVSCRYCNARDCAKTVLVSHIMESHPGKSRMTNMLKQLVCKDRKENRKNALSISSARSTSASASESASASASASTSISTSASVSTSASASAPPVDASTSASDDVSAVSGDDGSVDQNIALEIDKAASPVSPENTDVQLSCNEPGDKTSLDGTQDTSLDPVLGCQLCSYVGVNRHDLNNHIDKHDTNNSKVASSFPCTECPEGFGYLSTFEIHLRKHSKLLTYNLYICSVCKFEMGSKDEMLNHMANIHKLTGKAQHQFSRTLKVSKTDVLNCSSCPFKCLGQDVLDKHKQRCHLSGTNTIPNASMSNASTNEDPLPAVTQSEEGCEKHAGNTSKEKVLSKLKMMIPDSDIFISPVRCIACKFSSVHKANIQQHIDKNHPEIEVVVETGKIGSPVKKVRTDSPPKEKEQNEIRLHIGSPLLDRELEWLFEDHGSSYRCVMCSKYLHKKNYLHLHILDHLHISLWKCKDCDFKSSKKSTVKIHMKDIHDKKYHSEDVITVVDEVRPKIFKVLGKLVQDAQVVNDIKPTVGTKELDEKLKNKYNVNGKQKICRKCLTEHQSLYAMHSHILRRHYRLHLFKCYYCFFSALERYSVVKHCKEKHPEKELTVRYVGHTVKDVLTDESEKRHEKSHLSTTKSSSSDQSPSHETRTELRVGSDMLDKKLLPLYDVRKGKTRTLTCKSCHADHLSKYALHCHLLKHLKIKLVACPYCHFELLDQSKMGAHIKVVHPDSRVYFKFLDVDIESAVKDYLEKKECERNKPKVFKPKLSDILARRKSASPIKPVRSPGKISKNVMSVTVGGLKKFKCRMCDYMALTKNSVGTHVFKVHYNSGTKTTSITTNSPKTENFRCKICKFKTHLLDLLKSHYKHKHPLVTVDEATIAQEKNIESEDEGGDGCDDGDDDDFTPESSQEWPFLHAEKANCQSEEGNQNSESTHPEPAKEQDQHEDVHDGKKVVSDISERVKLKKRKEIGYEENAEVQPTKKLKTLESEPRRVSYKCPKCNFVDSSKTKGVLHLKDVHDVSKLMQCAYCTASFMTEDLLKNHIRFLHKGKDVSYINIHLESLLQEVTDSQPSEMAPGVEDASSIEASTLPEGSVDSDQTTKPAESSKFLKDKMSPEKDSNKIQHHTEAPNVSSKEDVSGDSKSSTNISHQGKPVESVYAPFVPSSPENSDHEERVYYKYVCVYCDTNYNSKSEIKTHLAKHCLERLHGNKIPETEEAIQKIKKKVRDIIPICVERANNKKIKISSQTEKIKPEVPSTASAAATLGQPTVQLKRIDDCENKAEKGKGDAESESDSDSIIVMIPAKKKRRRIKLVISSSDEDEPGTACEEKKSKMTSHTSRIYCCHLCRYRVGSLYKFRSHLASHGSFKHLNPDMSLGLLLKCGFCGYQAVDRENFSQHVEEHLDGRIYKCGYCKYDSYHSKNMRSHLKNKHRHKPEKIIDLRISMNEKALRPSTKTKLVNLDPVVKLDDVFMIKDFALLLKEQGVRTVDMDVAMKDVVLGEPGQMIEVMDMEIGDFSDDDEEEDTNNDDEYLVDDDGGGETSSSEGSDVPLGDLEFDDVSDGDLFEMAPSPTD